MFSTHRTAEYSHEDRPMPYITYTIEHSACESCGRHDDSFELSLTYTVPYSPDGPTVELHLDDVTCTKCELFDRQHNRQSGMSLDSHSRQFWEANFADAVRESVNLRDEIVRRCEADREASREPDTDAAWKNKRDRGAA